MAGGSKPKRERPAKSRMQVRSSIDPAMEDMYDWLSGIAPGKRGRELLAEARFGRAMRQIGGSLAALIAAAGLGTASTAAPRIGAAVATSDAAPADTAAAAAPAAAAGDLSIAAAEHAASAFGADFFSAAPALQ